MKKLEKTKKETEETKECETGPAECSEEFIEDYREKVSAIIFEEMMKLMLSQEGNPIWYDSASGQRRPMTYEDFKKTWDDPFAGLPEEAVANMTEDEREDHKRNVKAFELSWREKAEERRNGKSFERSLWEQAEKRRTGVTE